MRYARAAEIQVLLEGVPLPAEKATLLGYARHEGAEPHVLAALATLPEREYRTLDEVGEELVGVQPRRAREEPHTPRAESGAPPGGDDYTTPHPESGAVRDLDAA